MSESTNFVLKISRRYRKDEVVKALLIEIGKLKSELDELRYDQNKLDQECAVGIAKDMVKSERILKEKAQQEKNVCLKEMKVLKAKYQGKIAYDELHSKLVQATRQVALLQKELLSHLKNNPL